MYNKRTPLTKLLLKLITITGKSTVDFYHMLYDLRHHRGLYLYGGHDAVMEFNRRQNEQNIKRALYQLKYKKYIKTRHLGKRLEVSLTQKGLATTLATQLKQAPQSNLGYTIIIFDIPQSQNIARRQLRLMLKQGGFTKLQQSVWISDKDTYALLSNFIKKIKLQPWVNLFYGSKFLHLPQRFS